MRGGAPVVSRERIALAIALTWERALGAKSSGRGGGQVEEQFDLVFGAGFAGNEARIGLFR
jgi:hypothetical protein